MILAIYLIGIAAGSTAFRRFNRPSRENPQMLGVVLTGVGVLALTTVALASSSSRTIGLAFAVLLPATLFMGYSFPLAGRLLMRTHLETGRSVGLLYAANTAGSILGAFSAGFVLAPTFGGNTSVIGLAAIDLITGAVLLAGSPQAQRAFALVPALVAVVAVLASTFDSPTMRTKTQNALERRWGADQSVRITHSEDSLSTVDTVGGGRQSDRALYVNGVSMTAITIDTKLMAYLCKALRPDADRFLTIAFGMGGVYRAGLKVGMRTDVVELSPTVPKKMGEFFPDAQQYLDDPRGKIINSDGRNYVRLSRDKYDALVVDPAPPLASAGSVVLYTDEFIKQAKNRLNPGGVMMLWIPYDAPMNDWKAHMRTFRRNFTNATYITGFAGMYMFGSDGSLPFDREHLIAGLDRPGVLDDLRDSPDSRSDTVDGYAQWVTDRIWLTNDQIDRVAGDGPLITDDRPRSEYFLWRRIFKDDGPKVSRKLLEQEKARRLG
jgi:spermidine synthase